MSTFLVLPCAAQAFIYKILDNHNKNLSKDNKGSRSKNGTT